MRLSGVDPGIIRELSGIYKPFVKAFKELISNAYDADASEVAVTVDRNLSSIEVLDDGIGMTPFEFQKDFTRLGGSTARQRNGKSPGGRPRIGYKGIGFLAVARYCSQLQVETRSARTHKGQHLHERANLRSARIPLDGLFADAFSLNELGDRLSVTAVAIVNEGAVTPLKRDLDYEIRPDEVMLRSKQAKAAHAVRFDYKVDCRGLTLEATLDFDYLLSLADRADLRLLEDFCRIKIRPTPEDEKPFTRLRLHKLRDFVVRELGAPPAKGKARNILFKSGKDQFLWKLARSSPIRDQLTGPTSSRVIDAYTELQSTLPLPTLRVVWRDEPPLVLARQVYAPREKGVDLEQTVFPVEIDEGGLRVTGYLLARSEVLFPAELRGISVRVRNVAIGDASFFGWENLGSGPAKAALSQITGELLVLEGLQAADAINPGRESFYEESEHFRIFKRTLFGSGETLGGIVGQAVRSILDRIHVRSQVNEKLTAARERRRTLSDISSAVNYYSQSDGVVAQGLDAFFASSVRANGLATAKNMPLQPGHKLAGFEVETQEGLGADHKIDYQQRKIVLDYTHDVWDTTVYLNGLYYEVVFKQGKPEHPVCEFDNVDHKIYVNWAHPVKLQMDDVGFLKSAILLRLANHASPHDANAMLDLALNMLAFRAE